MRDAFGKEPADARQAGQGDTQYLGRGSTKCGTFGLSAKVTKNDEVVTVKTLKNLIWERIDEVW